MKNFKKQKLDKTKTSIKKIMGIDLTKQKERGITLIALVVTIIVLLILAGVSIQMLTGQSGILTQARLARDKTGRANIIEDAQRDIIEKFVEKQDDINKQELYEVLEKYFSNTPEIESGEYNDFPKNFTTELESKDGKHKIKIEEIYTGNLQDNETTEENYKEIKLECKDIENFTYDGNEYNPENLFPVVENNGKKFSGKTTYKCEKNIKDVGNYEIEIVIEHPNYINSINGEKDISILKKTFKIIPAPLIVYTDSAEKTYDGDPLFTKNGTISGLKGKDSAIINPTGSQTDAGSSPNYYEIQWDANTKETNYVVESEFLGSLVVSPRSIKFISGSASKVHDGAALRNTQVTVAGECFAHGEGASYKFTGIQIEVGSSPNYFEIQWNANTKETNYAVVVEYGTLTVL